MMVYMPENGFFLSVEEGYGDMLSSEYDKGYVDYVLIVLYWWDGDELVEKERYRMMLEELFEDEYGNDNEKLIKDSIIFMDFNVSNYVEIKEFKSY